MKVTKVSGTLRLQGGHLVEHYVPLRVAITVGLGLGIGLIISMGLVVAAVALLAAAAFGVF